MEVDSSCRGNAGHRLRMQVYDEMLGLVAQFHFIMIHEERVNQRFIREFSFANAKVRKDFSQQIICCKFSGY